MRKVYLSQEDSDFLRQHLNKVTPLSADAQDVLARVAANQSCGHLARDALELLKQKGYTGVEVKDGMIYLGLPRHVTRALREALAELVYRLNPKKGEIQLAQEDEPLIYTAVRSQNPLAVH